MSDRNARWTHGERVPGWRWRWTRNRGTAGRRPPAAMVSPKLPDDARSVGLFTAGTVQDDAAHGGVVAGPVQHHHVATDRGGMVVRRSPCRDAVRPETLAARRDWACCAGCRYAGSSRSAQPRRLRGGGGVLGAVVAAGHLAVHAGGTTGYFFPGCLVRDHLRA